MGGGGRNQPRQGQRQEERLPTAQPVNYFSASGAGRLRTELVDAEAEQLAKQFREMTSTQLRRFYGQVTTLQRRVEQEEERTGDKEKAFEALRADFKMLKAKVVYASKRKGTKIPRPFLQFVINHTHAVKNRKEFDAFCQHFQAVVAFHKVYAKDKE